MPTAATLFGCRDCLNQSSYAGYAIHRIEGENIALPFTAIPVGMVAMPRKTAVKESALPQEEVMKLFSVVGMRK